MQEERLDVSKGASARAHACWTRSPTALTLHEAPISNARLVDVQHVMQSEEVPHLVQQPSCQWRRCDSGGRGGAGCSGGGAHGVGVGQRLRQRQQIECEASATVTDLTPRTDICTVVISIAG